MIAGQILWAVLAVAASGPKAVELAGEVADGGLLMVGYIPRIVAAAPECLQRGAWRPSAPQRLCPLDRRPALRCAGADRYARALRPEDYGDGRRRMSITPASDLQVFLEEGDRARPRLFGR